MDTLAAPKPVSKMVKTLQTQSSTCLPPFVEEAATEAIKRGKSLMGDKIKVLEERKNIAAELINSWEDVSMIPPEGAFYVFIDIRKALEASNDYQATESLKFSSFLLENYHVAMVPGEAFGVPGFLRPSYAVANEKLIEGLNRLRQALDKIK